jgi:hypothetical protein
MFIAFGRLALRTPSGVPCPKKGGCSMKGAVKKKLLPRAGYNKIFIAARPVVD